MEPSDKGAKRKEKESTRPTDSMVFGVPINSPKTNYAATTSTAANPDHGCAHAPVRSREQSPDAMPLPDSDPNTPVKPKGKKQRAEMSA